MTRYVRVPARILHAVPDSLPFEHACHNWPIWERVIALLAAGSLDVAPIIGGVWPLEQWHEAFERMHCGEVVKSVLRPS